MLALRLPPDIEKRLDDLAKRTGRTKSFYAREAILEHIDDLEDYYIAQQRYDENGPRISLDEMSARYASDAELGDQKD